MRSNSSTAKLAALAFGVTFAFTQRAEAFGTSVEACTSPAGCRNGDSGSFAASANALLSVPNISSRSIASVNIGEMHLFATSTAQIEGFAFATATASFDDSFLVGADWRTVQITWVLTLAGSCSATPGASGGKLNAACGVQLNVGNGHGLALGLSGPGTVSVITPAYGPSVGFTVFGQAVGYAHNGTFAADFANTGSLFAYTTKTGAPLVSESGHNYLPVPEQATCFLLVAGLGALSLLAAPKLRSDA